MTRHDRRADGRDRGDDAHVAGTQATIEQRNAGRANDSSRHAPGETDGRRRVRPHERRDHRQWDQPHQFRVDRHPKPGVAAGRQSAEEIGAAV